jgi:hypothetical protein
MNTEDVLKEVQFRQVHSNLICFLGVGARAESVILAEISHVTTEEERTAILPVYYKHRRCPQGGSV